jgi:SapB morphogen precursor RamS
MAILDLQGMEAPAAEFGGGHKSSNSKSCHGDSGLSLLLC